MSFSWEFDEEIFNTFFENKLTVNKEEWGQDYL